MSPEVAFVLPGGGSAGAAQVGILRSLLEAGIRPDVLVGCSVGALNAAFFALDPTLEQVDRMETLWRGLTRDMVFGTNRCGVVARLLRHRDHLWSPRALRDLIAHNCPVQDLTDLAIPVEIVTTDIDNGVARWWRRGPARDILYATACLPGLLPPAILDGHRHVDGGVLEPAPVQHAVDLDAATVYVLGETAGPGDEQPPLRLSALDVLVRSFAVSRYARLPDPVGLARTGQRVIVVPGANTTGVAITDFGHTTRFLAESRERSRSFLRDSNFRDSNFRDSNFRDSNFCDSNFRDSNFRDSNFRDSNFCDSNFRDTGPGDANTALRDSGPGDADPRRRDMRADLTAIG